MGENQHSPGGDRYEVQAKYVGAAGPGSHGTVNVYEAPPELGEMLKSILAIVEDLKRAQIPADIAPPALAPAGMGAAFGGGAAPKPDLPSPEYRGDPSASLSGLLFRAPSSSAQIEQLTGNALAIERFLEQLRVRGGQVGAHAPVVRFANREVDVIDLLLKQGNVALWDFRRKAARLFSDHRLAILRGQAEWPHAPALQQFHARAQGHLDVFRGLILFYNLRAQRRELLSAQVIEQLMAGQWRQVLDAWVARQQLPDEMVEYMRTDLQSVGEPYRPAEVQAALKETIRLFSEVRQRQPENTVALVNLALAKTESALFFYIESGNADRAALREGHALFQEARDLLLKRTDREGRVALAKCLLYEATSLPAEAVLEAVQGAALQAQLYRASFTQRAQRTINWGMMQRQLARYDPGFYRLAEIQRARDLFLETGEHALAEQCAIQLERLERARAMLPQIIQVMRMAQPVVGAWACQGGTMLSRFQGMLVFDGDGVFHWLVDVQGMGGVQRFVSEGGYGVMGNVVVVQGERWLLSPQFAWAPGVPIGYEQFGDQLLIQGNMGGQLLLFSQQQGAQVACRRL